MDVGRNEGGERLQRDKRRESVLLQQMSVSRVKCRDDKNKKLFR